MQIEKWVDSHALTSLPLPWSSPSRQSPVESLVDIDILFQLQMMGLLHLVTESSFQVLADMSWSRLLDSCTVSVVQSHGTGSGSNCHALFDCSSLMVSGPSDRWVVVPGLIDDEATSRTGYCTTPTAGPAVIPAIAEGTPSHAEDSLGPQESDPFGVNWSHGFPC